LRGREKGKHGLRSLSGKGAKSGGGGARKGKEPTTSLIKGKIGEGGGQKKLGVFDWGVGSGLLVIQGTSASRGWDGINVVGEELPTQKKNHFTGGGQPNYRGGAGGTRGGKAWARGWTIDQHCGW